MLFSIYSAVTSLCLIGFVKAQDVVVHNWCPFTVKAIQVLTGAHPPETVMGTACQGESIQQPVVRWGIGNVVWKLTADHPHDMLTEPISTFL
jgi:hypothetical protein